RTVFAAFFEQCNFSLLLNAIDALIKGTDGYITARAPWKVASTNDRDQLSEILYASAEAVRIVTGLLHPFLPDATAKVWAQLGLGDIEVAAKNGDLKKMKWGGLVPDSKLGELFPIFPRAPKELIQLMTDMENSTNATPKPE